ncbi:hypothetical protein GH714_003438 [Hevea brasiliensis]|uniref:Uncharacterized protein n=1 Tax=Hevea brasiliensis TaxID=3981 RepID=A0A6A6KIQ9_HEVBR|nr:hypothetical protein GH714_003438 [Hevea brasiliensis]
MKIWLLIYQGNSFGLTFSIASTPMEPLKVANSTDEKGEAIVIPESLEGDVRGHSFKDCEAFSNDGVEDICVDSMPYGDWLRASPQSKSHSGI